MKEQQRAKGSKKSRSRHGWYRPPNNLFYCIALPNILEPDSWVQMFNHESTRLWVGLMSLGLIWGLGYYAHKTLLFEPKPPEKLKE